MSSAGLSTPPSDWARDSRPALERLRAGDGLAVDELMAQHLPALLAFARLRLGPMLAAKESAHDVVQSALREVIEGAHRFQYGGEAAFRAWLYTHVTRKIADRAEYWGAQRRHPAREEADDAGVLELARRTLGSPSEMAMGREALQRLDDAFARLPDDHREVILLSRVAGLTRAEIAVATGRSEASIRNLLPRALARLAELLTNAGDDARRQ